MSVFFVNQEYNYGYTQATFFNSKALHRGQLNLTTKCQDIKIEFEELGGKQTCLIIL